MSANYWEYRVNKELADLLDLCIEVNGESYFPCDVLYKAREHILALEKLNDQLHTLVHDKAGICFTVNNDAVFIDGFGELPLGVVADVEALQKLVEGGDIGRKVMSADIDNKTRLVSDHHDALNRALEELAVLQEAAAEGRDMLALVEKINQDLEAEVITLKAELKLVEQGA